MNNPVANYFPSNSIPLSRSVVLDANKSIASDGRCDADVIAMVVMIVMDVIVHLLLFSSSSPLCTDDGRNVTMNLAIDEDESMRSN